MSTCAKVDDAPGQAGNAGHGDDELPPVGHDQDHPRPAVGEAVLAGAGGLDPRPTLVRDLEQALQVLRERANARRAQQAAEPEQRVGSWEQVVWLDENVQAALFDRAGRGGVIVEGTRDLDVVRELLRGG